MANSESLLVSDTLLQSAEQRYRARLHDDPENAALLEQLGDVLRKMGRIDEAAATYERLARLRPGDEQVRYRHALLAGVVPMPLAPPGLQPSSFVLLKDF